MVDDSQKSILDTYVNEETTFVAIPYVKIKEIMNNNLKFKE